MSDEPNAANMLCVGINLFFDGHQHWVRHDGRLIPCDLRETVAQAVAKWDAHNEESHG